MSPNQEQKRAELRLKYENWIKKNRLRLVISFIIYIIILVLNYFFLKNNKLTLLASLLLFTYTIYVYSLIWFITKKLLTKINNIDFDKK